MPETAQAQVPRLVELLAWLSQGDSAKSVTYRAAARRLGVSEQTIRADLDALLELSAEHRDWLASLRAAVVADGFAAHSRGAFRRPLHFTGEEGMALLIGLAGARGSQTVAKRLSKALGAAPPAEAVEAVYALSGAPSEELKEFRNFRADRVLEAKLLRQDFRPHVLFQPIRQPEELLRADETVTAKVAFSPRIARWLKERYPDGREAGDGRYVVIFKVADAAWFVREVLQYGAEAEVLEPEGLREAVRRAVA